MRSCEQILRAVVVVVDGLVGCQQPVRMPACMAGIDSRSPAYLDVDLVVIAASVIVDSVTRFNSQILIMDDMKL